MTSFLNIAEDWEALPGFADTSKTYMDFKHQLFEIYTLRYPLVDLERLVSKQLRFGFQFLQDLTEYHLRFNAIWSHLLNLAFSRDMSSPSCTYSCPSTHPYAPLLSSDFYCTRFRLRRGRLARHNTQGRFQGNHQGNQPSEVVGTL